MAPPQGLQPHYHSAELPRERTARLSGPDQLYHRHQTRNCGGPGEPGSCTGAGDSGGLRHVGGGYSGTGPEPSLSDAQWVLLVWISVDVMLFRAPAQLKD